MPGSQSMSSLYTSALKASYDKLPAGFSVYSRSISFVPKEAPDLGELPMTLTLIKGDKRLQCGYALTKNSLPGAPIKYIRNEIGDEIDAVLINNKISNVCGANGDAYCSKVVQEAKERTQSSIVLPASTGVIGWDLPLQEMLRGVKGIGEDVERGEGRVTCPVELAKGIMTTDRYPKVRGVSVGSGTMLGVAKGAGMIEPNMGTMLCYVMTDVGVEGGGLQDITRRVADRSFNCVSVDGDESTSDMFVVMSSGIKGNVSREQFESALTSVATDLSKDIVRNGEGTSHVISVDVRRFPGPQSVAKELGKAVVNSPLVKTAIAGNDPNIGRVAGAVGSFMGKQPSMKIDWSKVEMFLGGTQIFKGGKFVIDSGTEKALSSYISSRMFDPKSDSPEHEMDVEFVIDFGVKDGENAKVWGSDLTKEYVAVNADYRS